MRLDVKMNVAEIYIAVLRAIRVVDVNRGRVESLAAHAWDVENRFKKGMASKNDLLAVQVALADAQQQAVQAHNALQMLCAAYNRGLRRSLTDPVHLVELPGSGDPGNVDELTKMACAGRPEIAGLSAQARALRAQADATRAKLAPRSPSAAAFSTRATSMLTPTPLPEWPSRQNGMPSIRAATANRPWCCCKKARPCCECGNDAESMVALEVRQKWLEVQTARDRLEFARKATAQADENLRVVRDRYHEGLVTNTEVLDAETLRAQAYMNLYNSYYESILAGLRVRRAVGNL